MAGKIVKKDCGHYVEVPLERREGTLVVERGDSVDRVFILPGDGSLIPPHIILNEGASLRFTVIVPPGVDKDISIEADLAGEGASMDLRGLSILGNVDKVSFHTEIRHRVGGCSSNQFIATLASGHSEAAFFGRIVVAPDAQKTEAYQSNRNILLSAEAKVGTTPQLEIYADDVKCSHGATVGSLDEEERFYMRSRGIPDDEAKVLQMLSFTSPALENIPDPSEKERLLSFVETELRKLV